MIRLLTSLLLSSLCLVLQASTPGAGDRGVVIRKGGTYRGIYRSLNSAVPCVRIATREPVILEGCTFAGRGDLVVADEGASLVVRNCKGYGLTPSVDDKARGRFVHAHKPTRLTIEHNQLLHTTGIVVNRWSDERPAGHTLTIRYNWGLNCDGRHRNGHGTTVSSFILLNTVARLPGIEISYNQFINQPNVSAVEDNINFYDSSGTANSPAQVHDNYVQGAYPYPAVAATFHGTGMTTDGNAKATAETTTAYVEAHHNQFISTCNAGMNIAAGHDIHYHDNRIVTSGLLPSGRKLTTTHAGTAVFNYYNLPADAFFNNRSTRNTIGYVNWGASQPYSDRQDLSPGHCADCQETTHLPAPVTRASEQREYVRWRAKVRQQGLVVGI